LINLDSVKLSGYFDSVKIRRATTGFMQRHHA